MLETRVGGSSSQVRSGRENKKSRVPTPSSVGGGRVEWGIHKVES